jgi:tetratricopeptide (TPR) repeat protein
VVLVSVLAARAAVAVSTADVRLGVARSCEQQRDLSCAVSLYTASRGDHSDTRPSIRLAALLAGEAETAGVERRDQLFRQAAAALTRAWSDDPFDYDHARNRGALERRWARRLPPGDRAPHLAEADRWYASAAGLAPAAPLLWEEWANLALERRRPDEALPRLERALALGLKTNEASTLADAWLRTTGIAADERQGFAEAVEEFRRRGYPKLAGLYAARAAASPRSQ